MVHEKTVRPLRATETHTRKKSAPPRAVSYRMLLDNIKHGIKLIDADFNIHMVNAVIEQIVGNIMGNAVKYLDHGRPGEIEVTGEANGGETIFRIRDNGRGIAEDDMDKVFAPFRRAGKQDTPGEGMGLAYVQTLVRRHNGRIWCESELEKGTTFTFTISNPSEQGVCHA
jgi:signal transduction histidine kinase